MERGGDRRRMYIVHSSFEVCCRAGPPDSSGFQTPVSACEEAHLEHGSYVVYALPTSF